MKAPMRLPAALQQKWNDLTARLQKESPALAAEADALLRETVNATKQRAMPADYSLCKSPLDAIVACLSAHPNLWRSTRSIIDEITQSGFGQDDWNRRANLRDAIYYHTRTTGKLLRDKDDCIGLPAWDLPRKPPRSVKG